MEAGVPTMIEEKITSVEGEVSYKKYLRGRFLGKVKFLITNREVLLEYLK